MKVDAELPKGGLVRGHYKPIHGSCAIYFPGGTDFVPRFLTGLDSHDSLANENEKLTAGNHLWFVTGRQHLQIVSNQVMLMLAERRAACQINEIYII